MSKFRIGDEVICMYPYAYIAVGARCKVVAVNKSGSLKLLGISGSYDSRNFELAPNDYSVKEDKDPPPPVKGSIYMAVEFSEYKDLSQLASQFNYNPNSINFMIDTSAVRLKDQIRIDLEKNPTNKWVILHGNTLAVVVSEARFLSL